VEVRRGDGGSGLMSVVERRRSMSRRSVVVFDPLIVAVSSSIDSVMSVEVVV